MRLGYWGARYYDPEVGVWTSTDPVGQYWNPYTYCGGNPVTTVDPNGEMGFTWGFDKGGITIGWSMGYYGFYSRFGWEDGGSYSTGMNTGWSKNYGGLQVGASAQTGTTLNFKSGELSQDFSAGVNAGYQTDGGEGIGIGFNTSTSFGYNSGEWSPVGWSVSAFGYAAGTYSSIGGSASYSGTFGGSGGQWGWGVNGSFTTYNEYTDYEEIEDMSMHRIEPFGEQDKFGHYWIEIEGEGFGYWPDEATGAKDALTNKNTGSVRGHDPHTGDRTGKNYKVYGPKGRTSAYYKEEINDVPSSYAGKQYGVPFGRNCHTYQRNFIRRYDLIIIQE